MDSIEIILITKVNHENEYTIVHIIGLKCGTIKT